jgi:hypothetical protein
MTTYSRSWKCWALAACLLGSPAAQAEWACPDSLQVEQRANPPSGWTASYSNLVSRLSGVAIFDGPPSNRASIKYNMRRQSASELRVRWDLIYSPRSHYVQCQYERTSAMISAPLPAGVRTCDVVYDRKVAYADGGMAVKRMVCK